MTVEEGLVLTAWFIEIEITVYAVLFSLRNESVQWRHPFFPVLGEDRFKRVRSQLVENPLEPDIIAVPSDRAQFPD